MLQEERWVLEQDNIKLQAIEGKPKGNIEINDKTIKAYQEEFTKKGMVITSKEDYPRDQFRMVQKQKYFDSTVDASKGIKKIIISMVRQPVHITGKDGKRVTKDALYYNGYYEGRNFGDIRIQSPNFHEGSYLRPRLEFSLVDSANPFDPQTGEKRGQYKKVADTLEHYIFLPEDKKERRKFLEDILAKYPDSYPEDLSTGGHLSFRRANPNNDHNSQHGGCFNWNQFCDLSLSELGEVQDKSYYKDKDGITRDKDGQRVEYNKSTGKMEAIK